MDDKTKLLTEQAGICESLSYKGVWLAHTEGLERFTELIRADERERLKKKGRLKMEFPKGCGVKLNLGGDWIVNCGDSDMGAVPWLCDECKKDCY